MKIRIQKFKQLDDVEIELANITLLVGGNNAGKSSILQAIQFGVSIAQATTLQENANWKNEGRLPTSIGQSELIYLPIKEISFLAKNGKLKEEKENAIKISYQSDDTSEVMIRKGRNKNIAIEITGEKLGKKLQSIEHPYSMLVTGLAGIPNEEKYQTPLVVKKSSARGDSNSVFRNILLLLQKNDDSWEKFKSEIKNIFPDYEINLIFDENKNEFIDCNVTKSDDTQYPIDTCGTGILQVIQIISYLYLFKPKILLLDEPDSHLHPNNQRVLADRLKHLSSEIDTKIVIATHSIYLVERLIDDANLLWLSNGKLKENTNKNIIEALMEIGALDAGQKLRYPEWILLTEDADTTFLKTLIEANGANLTTGEIKSFKGCTKIEAAQILLQYYKEEYPNAKFIIHRDRDFLDNSTIENWKNNFQDVNFLIPKFNDIESYFISPEHLSITCKLEDIDAAKNLLVEIFTNNKLDLIKAYVDAKKANYTFKEQSDKAGQLAAEAYQYLNEYNPQYIHGKKMLRKIRDAFNQEKIKDNINTISDSLKDNEIERLFQQA